MAITAPLQAIQLGDVAGAGGKGASLAVLTRAGLPVPPGFVVRTDAYRRIVEASDLWAAVEPQAQALQGDDRMRAAEASATIRALVAEVPLPDDIVRAIRDAYVALGAGAVAVRSSATAEDLPDASFAGQHETLLNVRGEEALLRAVRACWGSLWTPHAARYRARRGIPDTSVRMAVVVQRMVAATVSGVLFTRHPITGAADEIVINATWGLGEALVSGCASPDTFVASRRNGRLLRAEIADKQIQTVATVEGTAERAVPGADRVRRTLTDEQIARLTQVGIEIEELFGGPQDVEWALAGGQLFILQARHHHAGPPRPGHGPPRGAARARRRRLGSRRAGDAALLRSLDARQFRREFPRTDYAALGNRVAAAAVHRLVAQP